MQISRDVPPQSFELMKAVVLLSTLAAAGADVPTVEIKSCADGGVTVTDFKQCATPLGQPAVPAAQALSVRLCHDSVGLHIQHNATDKHIFSPWTHCNDNVFINSDVLEVFIAPVKDPYDVPAFYHEIDTGGECDT